jgi:hypothetical protein
MDFRTSYPALYLAACLAESVLEFFPNSFTLLSALSRDNLAASRDESARTVTLIVPILTLVPDLFCFVQSGRVISG